MLRNFNGKRFGIGAGIDDGLEGAVGSEVDITKFIHLGRGVQAIVGIEGLLQDTAQLIAGVVHALGLAIALGIQLILDAIAEAIGDGG